MRGTNIQLLDVNLIPSFGQPKGIRELVRIAIGFILQRDINFRPTIMGLA